MSKSFPTLREGTHLVPFTRNGGRKREFAAKHAATNVILDGGSPVPFRRRAHSSHPWRVSIVNGQSP
jgi:hypothetical protein